MQLVCPDCLTKNRVPDERLSDHPVCGKCGQELMSIGSLNLNDESFERYVEGTEMPVVVDFWAEWCGPCKVMGPQFTAAAKQLTHVRFAKVNTEAAPRTSAKYQIKSIPTMALFKNGLEIARMSGALSAPDIVRWIESQGV